MSIECLILQLITYLGVTGRILRRPGETLGPRQAGWQKFVGVGAEGEGCQEVLTPHLLPLGRSGRGEVPGENSQVKCRLVWAVARGPREAALGLPQLSEGDQLSPRKI